MRRTAAPDLIDEIDALKEKLEVRLSELVDAEAAACPGIPKGVLRDLLLRGVGDGAFFASMRRLLIERNNQERAA